MPMPPGFGPPNEKIDGQPNSRSGAAVQAKHFHNCLISPNLPLPITETFRALLINGRLRRMRLRWLVELVVGKESARVR